MLKSRKKEYKETW